MHKKTTLKDIAEKLNITVATVSRALNNHPDISDKIKDQVKFLAETLHYRPNSFALQLRRQRSGIIGVVVPKIVHHFSSTIISGIMAAAHEKNYQILLCESGNSPELEKESINSLINSGVDGLLISLSNNTISEDYFAEIQHDGIPIVFFDKTPIQMKAHKITTNDYKGAFMATEHLIEQGYKKIAHLRGQPGSRNSLPRYQGYADGLLKHKHCLSSDMVVECLQCNEEEGFEKVMKMMNAKNRPDAIFAINDETSIGALSALRQLNIKVPEEFGIVGFSNSTAAAYVQPRLTSVAQAGKEMGSIAINLLLECINADKNNQTEFGYYSKMLDPELIIRESSLRISL